MKEILDTILFKVIWTVLAKTCFFFFFFWACEKMSNYLYKFFRRPNSWSYRSLTKLTHGNKPFPLWNLQQGIPKGPKLAAASTRPQPAMEAEAKINHWDQKESLRLPRTLMCSPQPGSCTGWSDGHQEALFQEARWEKVEMWEVL